MSPYQILVTTNLATGKKMPDIEALSSIATKPTLSDYTFIQARKADYEKAEKLADDLLKKNKENKVSLFKRISIYFKLTKYLNTIKDLNNYIDIRSPDYRGYVYVRSSIYYGAWDYIRNLEKELFGLSPDNISTKEIRIF